MIAKDHPAYVYAKAVLAGKIRAPKYVILQCSEFVFIARGKSERYVLDTDRLQKIENLLDLMVTIGAKDEASDKVSGIGSRITGVLGGAAKVGASAIGAIATGVSALTGAAHGR